MNDIIEIVPIEEGHVEGFWRALDSVARERCYLLFLEAPPLAEAEEFVKGNIRDGVPQFVAVSGGRVIGWCDICPHEREGLRHFGKLGMGIVDGFRERGLGAALLERTLEAAAARGISRVEAEVFASNVRARALYERMGFAHEGIKRRARFVDGVWDDFIVMAQVTDAGVGTARNSRSEG
jgi:RimJ/RimL family protein N-acetyltransferase